MGQNIALKTDADELLAAIAGPGASLRDDQWAAIDALVNNHRRIDRKSVV